MSSFVAANMSSLVKICDPETYDMVLKVTARPMIQVNIPEHYLSPVQDPPEDNHRRKVGTSSKGFASPGESACLVQREPRFGPPGFSLQPFGCDSNGSSSTVAQPKKHAPHLKFKPSSFQSYCWEKFTLVAPVELPRESTRDPTQQSVKAMWQGKT